MRHETDYVVCRCEDVSLAEIAAAVEAGATTAQEVKFDTRAAMGFCQGRVCRTAVEAALQQAGLPIEAGGSSMTVRLPVRPIPLADLADPGAEQNRSA